MNKLGTLAVIAGVTLVIGVVMWQKSRRLVVSPTQTPTSQPQTWSPSPAAGGDEAALDESQFKDKATTDKTIETELNNLDNSVKTDGDSDFGASGLSNTELGL